MSNADFSPVINNKKELGAFRFWCQKVLPLTYDDSLSYYELLAKVVHILNDVISNQLLEGEDIQNLANSFNELQGYVNNYFQTVDIQNEINRHLDELVSDGTMSELLAPIFNAYASETTEKVDSLELAVGRLSSRVLTIATRQQGLEDEFDLAVSAVTTDTEVTNIRRGTVGRTVTVGGVKTFYDNVYDTAGQSVRMQLDNMLWNVSKTRIGEETADLDDYKTPGNYYIYSNADASNVLHLPPVDTGVDKSCFIKILNYCAPEKDYEADNTYSSTYPYPLQVVCGWNGAWAYARVWTGTAWEPWKNLNWNVNALRVDGGTLLGESSVDLDNIKNVGNYYIQTTAQMNRVVNAPCANPGTLKVIDSCGVKITGDETLYRTQVYAEWNSNGIYIRSTDANGNYGLWESVSKGFPEEQLTDDITVEHRAGMGSSANYWVHEYLANGDYNPGYCVGFITDVHQIPLEKLDALLDYFIENKQVKVVINLGDLCLDKATDMDVSYIKHIYDRLFNAGIGFASCLGNHDVQGLTGQETLDLFCNGTNDEIILNQPDNETTGFKCGFIYGVDSNGLIWGDSSNVNNISTLADRVYMIQTYVRGQITYQPIYLGCCYDIKYNVVGTDPMSRRVCMHELDNSISIFAKVCNFLSDKDHSPWIMCAHEFWTLPVNASYPTGYQHISNKWDIYSTDDENGESNDTYNWYVTQFSQGGHVWTSAVINELKYKCFTRLMLAMEKGTSTGTLTFNSPQNGSEGQYIVPARNFNWVVDIYTALNDVALYVSGHEHIDLEYSRPTGYDPTYPDVSSSALVLTTNNTNNTQDYSDIIYDRNDRFYQNTNTTIACCPRKYRDGSFDNHGVTYIAQRFGAQNTTGGIPRKKLIYSRPLKRI